MLQLIIEGHDIDLKQDQSIQYTKRVADFGAVESVMASYTNSFKAPRTPTNTRAFEALGIVGDTSRVPYRVLKGRLLEDGITIIPSGVVTITETSEDYKVNIIDGAIDFFRFNEDKTLGNDLDLSELAHSKTIANIVASWTSGSAYRYLIGNYGNFQGPVDVEEGRTVNGSAQIPSVKLSFLWDKIFENAGYTYSGNFDLTTEWITFPKPIQQDPDTTLYFHGEKNYANFFPIYDDYKDWDVENLSPPIGETGTILNNWQYEAPTTGSYTFTFTADGQLNYDVTRTDNVSGTEETDEENRPYNFRILKNGAVVGNWESSTIERTVTLSLTSGDVIDFILRPYNVAEFNSKGWVVNPNFNTVTKVVPKIIIAILDLDIIHNSEIIIDFGEAFGNFGINEFFKEIVWRYALTPFVDNEARHIHFMTMDERIEADTVDWSRKYVRRTNEQYTYGTYARNNRFTHKYQGEETGFNDGIITIGNLNLKGEISIINSKIYSPLRDQEETFITSGSIFMSIFPMWEEKITTDENAVSTVEYSPLSDRYYILKEKIISHLDPLDIDYVAISFFDDNGNFTTHNTWPKAETAETFNEIVPSRYEKFNRVLDDTRIHDIEVAIDQVDIASLDMSKLYFFEQEQNRYILNKITWKNGQPCKGEFIRVKGNEQGQPASEIDPPGGEPTG